jgi:hypothetical protein
MEIALGPPIALLLLDHLTLPKRAADGAAIRSTGDPVAFGTLY